MPHRLEGIAVAKAPQVHHVQAHGLGGEAVAPVLQSALRTQVAHIHLLAVGACVSLQVLLYVGLIVLLTPLQPQQPKSYLTYHAAKLANNNETEKKHEKKEDPLCPSGG